jgi:hypothetical protein
MAKPLEEFVKEYSALMRELDGAAQQLKEAEQQRAQHDDAIHGDARALGQRVGRLRAGGAAGLGLDDFKTDAEVRRILAGLDERLAQAEADRLHYQELAAGAWKKTLDRTAALEKDLALEIATRQKLATTKVGVGNKSLPDMLRLQTDVRK